MPAKNSQLMLPKKKNFSRLIKASLFLRYPAIVTLNISGSKFEEIAVHNNTPSISTFFNKKNKIETATNTLDEQVTKTLIENENDGRFSGVNLPNAYMKEGIVETSSVSSLVSENRGEENARERVNGVKNEEEVTSSGKTAHNSKLTESTFSAKKGIKVFFSGKNSNERKAKNGERQDSSLNPYQGCEIDSAVLESLPDEIRREIEQSLVRSNRRGKKTIEGNTFFGPRVPSSGKESAPHNMFNKETSHSFESEGFSDGEAQMKNVCNKMDDSTYLQQCEKCGESLPDWEMPEHLDYHFALELQKVERNSTAAAKSDFSTNEPPKKKQRTTIQSFFTPK